MGILTQRDKDMMDQTGKLILCPDLAMEIDEDHMSVDSMPSLNQRTAWEDSDSEDEDEFDTANKKEITEKQDPQIKEYLSEMRLNEEDELPKFDLTRNMEEDEDEDEQVAKWRRRLMRPAPASRTREDPPERRVSFNETLNETKTYTPSNY